jgi:hypothetical protein
MNPESGHFRALVAIKTAHTLVWIAFVGCILAIPLAGARGWFRAAAILSVIILAECLILAANRGRCPLTDLAMRYTDERADNFDIYLPLWLARYNKTIFGALYVVGDIFVLVRWFTSLK